MSLLLRSATVVECVKHKKQMNAQGISAGCKSYRAVCVICQDMRRSACNLKLIIERLCNARKVLPWLRQSLAFGTNRLPRPSRYVSTDATCVDLIKTDERTKRCIWQLFAGQLLWRNRQSPDRAIAQERNNCTELSGSEISPCCAAPISPLRLLKVGKASGCRTRNTCCRFF